MDLRDYLAAIAQRYRTDESVSSAGHTLLKAAAAHVGPLVPGGLKVEGSGGKGVATPTPWIGVFDPDETETPQEGIYVVYIYSGDRKRVYLTLNQGVTKLKNELGKPAAIAKLRGDVRAIRAGMDPAATADTLTDISFGVKGDLQQLYEAGNIWALEYDTVNLPPTQRLEAHLDRFLDLYQEAVSVKQHLLLTSPGTISSPSKTKTSKAGATAPTADPLRKFAPKSDADYVAHLTGTQLVKSRRHETLVRQFGEYAATRGLSPATNVHPRDMTLSPSGQQEWLVEAKIVYNGNVTSAVRETIGQLLQYRHFLYPPGSTVRLLALFSEPIGDAYLELLEALTIAPVWKHASGWAGGASARAGGLIE